MEINVGDIVKIQRNYFEVTGTALLESYGFIYVVSLNRDTAEEVRVNKEHIDLVWGLKPETNLKTTK